MAKYEHFITSQEELDQNWNDPACPNFGMRFDQIELSECVDNEDGTYTATYTSLECKKETEWTYIDVVNGGTITYTLAPGEYGILPNSRRVS